MLKTVKMEFDWLKASKTKWHLRVEKVYILILQTKSGFFSVSSCSV